MLFKIPEIANNERLAVYELAEISRYVAYVKCVFRKFVHITSSDCFRR